jgi:hypothetical protein
VTDMAAYLDAEDGDMLTCCMSWGQFEMQDEDIQLLKFLSMVQHGDGASREFTRVCLEYCRASGGRNLLLPATVEACSLVVDDLGVKLYGHRGLLSMEVPIPQDCRDLVPPLFSSCTAFSYCAAIFNPCCCWKDGV